MTLLLGYSNGVYRRADCQWRKHHPGKRCCGTCDIDTDNFDGGAVVNVKWEETAGSWSIDATGGTALSQCVKSTSANAVLTNTTDNSQITTFAAVQVYVANTSSDARVRFCWDQDLDTFFEARYTPTGDYTGKLGLYWFDGSAYQQIGGDVSLMKGGDALAGVNLGHSGKASWHWLRVTWTGEYVGAGFTRHEGIPACSLGTDPPASTDDWLCLGEETVWCTADDLTTLGITPTGYAVALAKGNDSVEVRFDDFLWRATEAGGDCQTPEIRCRGDYLHAARSPDVSDASAQWEQHTGTWTWDTASRTMAAGAAGDILLWHRHFRTFDQPQALFTVPIFDTVNDVADFIFDWRDANNYRFRRFIAHAALGGGITIHRGNVYEVVAGAAAAKISPGDVENHDFGGRDQTATNHGYFIRSPIKAAWVPANSSGSGALNDGDVLHLDYGYAIDEPTRWGWRATTKAGTIKIGFGLMSSIGDTFACKTPGAWCPKCSDDDSGVDDTISVLVSGFAGDCGAFNGTWVLSRIWTSNRTCLYYSAGSAPVTGMQLELSAAGSPQLALQAARSGPVKLLSASMPAGTLECLDLNGAAMTVLNLGTLWCTGGTVTLWNS